MNKIINYIDLSDDFHGEIDVEYYLQEECGDNPSYSEIEKQINEEWAEADWNDNEIAGVDRPNTSEIEYEVYREYLKNGIIKEIITFPTLQDKKKI